MSGVGTREQFVRKILRLFRHITRGRTNNYQAFRQSVHCSIIEKVYVFSTDPFTNQTPSEPRRKIMRKKKEGRGNSVQGSLYFRQFFRSRPSDH